MIVTPPELQTPYWEIKHRPTFTRLKESATLLSTQDKLSTGLTSTSMEISDPNYWLPAKSVPQVLSRLLCLATSSLFSMIIAKSITTEWLERGLNQLPKKPPQSKSSWLRPSLNQLKLMDSTDSAWNVFAKVSRSSLATRPLSTVSLSNRLMFNAVLQTFLNPLKSEHFNVYMTKMARYDYLPHISFIINFKQFF